MGVEWRYWHGEGEGECGGCGEGVDVPVEGYRERTRAFRRRVGTGVWPGDSRSGGGVEGEIGGMNVVVGVTLTVPPDRAQIGGGDREGTVLSFAKIILVVVIVQRHQDLRRENVAFPYPSKRFGRVSSCRDGRNIRQGQHMRMRRVFGVNGAEDEDEMSARGKANDVVVAFEGSSEARWWMGRVRVGGRHDIDCRIVLSLSLSSVMARSEFMLDTALLSSSFSSSSSSYSSCQGSRRRRGEVCVDTFERFDIT